MAQSGGNNTYAESNLENRCIREGKERLLEEWHPTKNGDLRPNMIGSYSRRYVWWKCAECGHEWQAPIKNRVGYGKQKPTKCPRCSKRSNQTLREWCVSNDRKDILEEFDTERNSMTPSDLSAHSSKKVRWRHYDAKSDMIHPWVASVNSRTKPSGTGCPYCAGVKTLTGYNDLATTYPDLMPYWDFELNDIDPTKTPHSHTVSTYWKCPECGHTWRSKAKDVAKKEHPCSKCCKRKKMAAAIEKTGPLSVTNPDVAALWHPTKNGDLKPQDVAACDGTTVWWCMKSNIIGRWIEWQDPINYRVARSHNDTNQEVYIRLTAGINDLATTHPFLSEEWSEKNEQPASNAGVGGCYSGWWKCSCCGNEWHLTAKARAAGSLCPNCESRISAGAAAVYRKVISTLDAVPTPSPLGLSVRCRMPFDPFNSRTYSPDRPVITLMITTLLDGWKTLTHDDSFINESTVVLIEAVDDSISLVSMKYKLSEETVLNILSSLRNRGITLYDRFLIEDDAALIIDDVVCKLGG